MKIIFSKDRNVGFNGKTNKLGLISKKYFKSLSPENRAVILQKKLDIMNWEVSRQDVFTGTCKLSANSVNSIGFKNFATQFL